MKNQKKSTLAIRSSLALALAVAIWSPALVRSAEPEDGMMMKGDNMMSGTNRMPRAGAMKEQRRKMMAELKAQDELLNTQVKEMNRAPADKKLDLMAAVITTLAEQRTASNVRMEKMQEEMMALREMGKEPISPDAMMEGYQENSGSITNQSQP